MDSKKLSKLLFILAFIEGGAVMCVELCSAKILTPYFGTSIYVWAAVLGITLTALMSGYYLGGYLSSRNKNEKMVFWLMLLGGLLMVLTPMIADIVLPITIDMSIGKGSIISLLCFLFFPLMFFGATSPLLINLITTSANESGKSSGTVYAVSTLGGIITTFLIGFYALPELGISITLYCYGFLILAYTTFLFLFSKKLDIKVAALVALAILGASFKTKNGPEVIYHTEGILGDLKVVDRVIFNPKEGRNIEYRSLLVNNTSQTIMNKENPEQSYWDYVDVLNYNLEAYSSGKKTLLLGLGGGTLYKKLERNSFDVEVVELDERILYLAKEYFEIENDINATVDDARHFFRTTPNTYDIVIYDLFLAETPPSHLMTKEAFGELQDRLSDNGILVINFFGYISGDLGKSARSIYKTLAHEGYNIRLLATPGEEHQRNLLFICSKEEINSKKQIIHPMIYEMDLNLEDAVVLTDDKPILEHLYLEAAISWRKGYTEFNTKALLNNRK